jgi:hypothetical protein
MLGGYLPLLERFGLLVMLKLWGMLYLPILSERGGLIFRTDGVGDIFQLSILHLDNLS